MNRASLAALSALIAVAAGAFGAHALKESVEPARLAAFETAARYQIFHALAVLVLELHARTHARLVHASSLMLLGTVLFSGSLYALVLSGQRMFGMITPLGGFVWLLAWLWAAFSLARPAAARSE